MFFIFILILLYFFLFMQVGSIEAFTVDAHESWMDSFAFYSKRHRTIYCALSDTMTGIIIIKE